MSLIKKQAPHFTAKAVINQHIIEDFSLERFKGQYVILLFYPLDFTFVCPTELHAYQEKLDAFKERNAEVVACSIDSPFTHLAWLTTPKTRGGIEGISYPIISDIHKSAAKAFQVLSEEEGIAFRGLFIIDREGVIRHETVNDLPLGRSVDETLRTLDSLIYFEKHGEVCPADWRPGKAALKTTRESVEQYFCTAGSCS